MGMQCHSLALGEWYTATQESIEEGAHELMRTLSVAFMLG